MRSNREKGITLMALVITIVIIIIIAGVSISAGIDSIESANFMKFQSELTMVQTKINEITAQYQKENKSIGWTLTNEERGILNKEEVNTILTKKAEDKGISVEELKNGFSLCSKEYIAEELGLENLTRNYLVNLKNAIVVALEKCKFEGTDYYMLEQIESSIYNVTYNSQITPEGTFTATSKQIVNGYQISITTNHDKYVSKWEVRYKLKIEKEWKRTENLTFNVETPGTYEIQVFHGDEVDLGTQTLIIKAGEPDAEGYYTQNSAINGRTVSTAYNPVVPKGFKPIEDESTGKAQWGEGSTAPTREAVKSGLVIQSKDGSQYVWIPVDDVEVKLSRYSFNTNGSATIEAENSIADGGYLYEELATSTLDNAPAKDIEKFKASVQQNGGYYIARYEASKGENGKALSVISKGTPAGQNSSNTSVSTGMLWNWVTQQEASNACQGLYSEIQSDLINSYAWDTAIVFIQKNADIAYSQRRGPTYSDTLKNTGTSNDVQCNIYDMAANTAEWTTETCNTPGNPCVYRGGIFEDSSYSVGNRVRGNSSSFENYNITFRSILYW